ncbi:MAG: hypothetical protein ABIG66_00200 [Candidatus Kerfeldbacteria bacterium]
MAPEGQKIRREPKENPLTPEQIEKALEIRGRLTQMQMVGVGPAEIARMLDAEAFLYSMGNKTRAHSAVLGFDPVAYAEAEARKPKPARLPEHTTKLKVPLMPPDKQEIKTGSGEGWKDREIILRTQYMQELLTELEIDYDLIDGTNTEEMMRSLSYKGFVIKDSGKIVMVNDEEGEATYVIHSIQEDEESEDVVKKFRKSYWRRHPELATYVEWEKEKGMKPEEWKAIVAEHLRYTEEDLADSEIGEIIEMNAEYFQDADIVRRDLEAIAEASGVKGASIADITMSKRYLANPVTFASGRTMEGNTYLNKAAIAEGKARTTREANKHRLSVLNDLKRLAGVEQVEYKEMDKEYFEDAATVTHDLQVIADAVGKDITIETLSTAPLMIRNPVTFMSGEKLIGHTYLCKAGVALGLFKTLSEASNNHRQILDVLKKTAGVEVADYAPLDEVYFSNPYNIHRDLEAIVSASEEEVPIDQISTSHKFMQIPITLSNGQTMLGISYLTRAGIALGMGRTARDAKKYHTEILQRLKEMAGADKAYADERRPEVWPPRYEYYSNRDNVRHDFEAFARELGEGVSIEDLTANSIRPLRIVNSDGESINGRKFISQAGIAIGMASTTREAEKMTVAIFDRLKSMVGDEEESK